MLLVGCVDILIVSTSVPLPSACIQESYLSFQYLVL
jgi:hypothetical protein